MLDIRFEAVENKVNQEETVLPKRKTAKSAGYDFVMPYDLLIPAGETSELFFTDVKVKLPSNMFLALHIRSSLGIKKGLMLANCTGIVDADYYNNEDNEGNIGVKIRNCSNEDVFLEKGSAVMQGIVMRYYTTIDDNVRTKRSGGFGSTDEPVEED